jgi:DNA-binding transcriptional LysR family regulator
MSDNLEFRHLRYIVAIAETGNFTRAANRLFLTQPSLSRQIKDVEDDIGFPIFLRHRKGVDVTPAGQLVVSYAQEALEERAEFIRAARALRR